MVRQTETMSTAPSDLRHIVPTLLDVDHAGGLGDFPDAQVHVFRADLFSAHDPREFARALAASSVRHSSS